MMIETLTISKTKTEIKSEVKTFESEERQTIIHCNCISNGDDAYRIWPSTYLVEHGSDKRIKLVTAFNISFAPQWTINDGKGFTLIFEGLSKDCKSFDLIEMIPQAGGFEVFNIPRNNMDVYQVRF